ncbi:hypothetical protein [Prosthecomicrobium sp. N25]|uniref:hypothetical protein n=1 Tax=Prosthecomicrobium sp. N25 TaxID=3129254 RepID=UPI0030772DC9
MRDRRFPALLRFALAAVAAVAGGVGTAQADCTCRALGRDFALGQTACLRVGDRSRLARCDMALNNTSWTFIDESCPAVSEAEAPMTVAVLPHLHIHEGSGIDDH